MSVICLTSAYLAPVSYFERIVESGEILMEQWDSYEKQSYRNRCIIATANGKLALSIPIEKSSNPKPLTRDVQVSNHLDWQMQHWRAIESAYNSSPFFEFYKDDFIPLYEKKWKFLWDFNHEIQLKVFELLEIQPKIVLTTQFNLELSENVLDLRKCIHPKNDLKINTQLSYYQVFENKFGFTPDLSIIDLLFNMGNEAQLVLNNKEKKNIFYGTDRLE
jgi:hypothetical protein